MRTCKNCGCYLPDNWTTCPACFIDEKQPQEIKKIAYKETKPCESLSFNTCRVDVLRKNYTKSSNFFVSYDNAIKFARLMACEEDYLYGYSERDLIKRYPEIPRDWYVIVSREYID